MYVDFVKNKSDATTLSADDQLTSCKPAAGSHDQTEEQPPSNNDKQ